MKKLSVFICLISLFFAGCASTKVDVSTLDKIAIISIGGNRHLPWYEKVDGKEPSATQGILSKSVDSILKDEDPEISEAFNRLDYAEDSFKKHVNEILSLNFVPKEDVIGSKRYRAMSEGILHSLNTTITAQDYKDVRSPDRFNMRKMAQEIEANSFVVLNFEFFKKAVKGSKLNGEISPYIKMKVKLYNNLGKEIKNKTYVVQGTESVKSSGKNYDKEALVAMYPAVIDQLMMQFALDFIQ